MSKLDKDEVIAKFTEAYTAANGKAPEIEAAGGWYSVNGDKKVRLAALNDMADELAGGAKAAPAEEKKEAPAKKAVKPAKKPAAKKAAKKGFSVKAFWAEQLPEGSRQPR